MPYKDPESARRSARESAQKRRNAQRETEKAAHPLGPLGWEGERLILKWVRKGEYLLRKMIRAHQRWEDNKEALTEYNHNYNVANKEKIAVTKRLWTKKNEQKVKKYKHGWYEENKERLLAEQAFRYQEKKPEIQAVHQAYYLANRITILLHQKLYYLMNRDTILTKQKIYYYAHLEERYAYEVRRYALNSLKRMANSLRWQREHPAEMASYRHKRRERIRNASRNDLTTAQWEEMKAVYNHRCVYCAPDCKACKKKSHKLTQEHLTPVSKDGQNTVSNVVPACRSCNSKKHDGPVLSAVQPLLLTMAPARKPK